MVYFCRFETEYLDKKNEINTYEKQEYFKPQCRLSRVRTRYQNYKPIITFNATMRIDVFHRNRIGLQRCCTVAFTRRTNYVYFVSNALKRLIFAF